VKLNPRFASMLVLSTILGNAEVQHLAWADESKPPLTQSATEAPTKLGSKDNPARAVEKRNSASTLRKRMSELERSTAFRKAAGDAWHAIQKGNAPFESGFAIDQHGQPGELQSSMSAAGERAHHLSIVFSSDSLGTFHVHNNFANAIPSPADISIAKTTHKIVYVSSREGLYSITPDGNVRHVFINSTWFDQKK